MTKKSKDEAERVAENARFDDDDNEIENGDDDDTGEGDDDEAEATLLEDEPPPEITEFARVVGANVSDTVSNAAKRLKDMAVT